MGGRDVLFSVSAVVVVLPIFFFVSLHSFDFSIADYSCLLFCFLCGILQLDFMRHAADERSAFI